MAHALLIALFLVGSICWQPMACGEETDTTDWPMVIAQLQQELYRRPGHASTRQQLAVAYNNYGVGLGNKGKWDLAIQQLQEALRLDEANAQARDNLSRVYLNQAHEAARRHQGQEALQAIDQALSLNPNLAQAYALRGEIEYQSQKLKEAKASWKRALELDPTQTDLKKQLDQLTQELPVESDFERLPQAYFDIRYQEELERAIGFDVRDVLLDARREVGSDFAYWPKHRLVVLVYSWESFRALRQETPDWVGGQFDGKIRMPLPNGQVQVALVKQILFHEYTHALVHDLTNGLCPTWLNEGLAEYEGWTQHAGPLTQLINAHRDGRLIPWAELSNQFSMALPAEAVALGYQESYSVVRYLTDRWGFWRIRRLLKAVGDGRPWDAALPEEYRLKLTTLEHNWRNWLPELLKQAP